jgi:hypothetical protein
MLERLGKKLASLPSDAREKVVVVVDDMRRFTIAERFALIIAPFRAFPAQPHGT